MCTLPKKKISHVESTARKIATAIRSIKKEQQQQLIKYSKPSFSDSDSICRPGRGLFGSNLHV
jgi:hypothetical protein